MFHTELYKDAPAVSRYLFRALSPVSDGVNHHSGFKSLAWSNRLFRNSPDLQHLATHHRADAQDIVMNHIKWLSRQYCPGDILISFTSSLLHVLTHATYKDLQFSTNPTNDSLKLLDHNNRHFKIASLYISENNISIEEAEHHQLETL